MPHPLATSMSNSIPEVFRAKRVLDIGCNEGAVTCEIGIISPGTATRLTSPV